MASLTGSNAVDRLEQRGGQIWVFRRGYGIHTEFICIDREDGHAVVVGKSRSRASDRYGPRRFVLATQADRDKLAHDIDHALEAANDGLERVEYRYKLEHRASVDADAGYAQVGCLLAFVSVVVGLVVGLIGSWIATGTISGDALVLGSIIGLLVGLIGIAPASAIAKHVPAFRDRAEVFDMGWYIVVPAVVTAVTIIGMAITGRAG